MRSFIWGGCSEPVSAVEVLLGMGEGGQERQRRQPGKTSEGRGINGGRDRQPQVRRSARSVGARCEMAVLCCGESGRCLPADRLLRFAVCPLEV